MTRKGAASNSAAMALKHDDSQWRRLDVTCSVLQRKSSVLSCNGKATEHIAVAKKGDDLLCLQRDGIASLCWAKAKQCLRMTSYGKAKNRTDREWSGDAWQRRSLGEQRNAEAEKGTVKRSQGETLMAAGCDAEVRI